MSEQTQHRGLRRVDGVIAGFRAWVPSSPDVPPWVPKRPHLLSTSLPHSWSPGVNVAAHLRCPSFWDPRPPPVDHAAPWWGCQCGFYIMRDLPSLMRAIQGLDLKGNLVFGVVAGWGKTVQHRLGWRCQYASIAGLLNQPQLARDYQVDAVADETELRELAEWAGGRAAHPMLRDYLHQD